ncbi:hypothetical protein DPMN_031441 [Dreissena polymorpha]|uniref:Uncharacterized protein n=1 Tax=Dreissena polymorpha TaxID=45954 RepID=A0A9D4M120_DREPO|nr:hypothetical protein DPMN_031441 [Dreissena polymorpha]
MPITQLRWDPREVEVQQEEPKRDSHRPSGLKAEVSNTTAGRRPQPHPAGDYLPVITPVPAAAASKKRTHKPYYYATLTEAQKEEVIDWLKDISSIYSKRPTD